MIRSKGYKSKTKIMRKSIIILFLIFISIPAWSQDTIPDRKIYYEYCELVGKPKAFSSKIAVSADFGDERGWLSNAKMRDEATGKIKSFNSMIDALNFMSSYGWEFVHAYVTPQVSSEGAVGNETHWILKRELEETDIQH